MGASDTVGIVGGGIVGLAVAREVLRRRPGSRVVVWEAEPRVAAHQTGHNSGVVHAGLYYRPGSLKASLCTRGRSLLREYCAEHGVAYVECGKLVVAVDETERARFDALERTARDNGVPQLRRLDGAAAIADVEPHAVGLVALHSPRTAITDYVAVAEAFAADVRAGGGEVRLGTPVTGVRTTGAGVVVDAASPGHEPTALDRLIVCGGLQSDRLAAMVGAGRTPRIVPFRGEYLRVSAAKQEHVRGMVYPVPDPRYPFLGVHFTRRVDGTLEIGPNAFLSLSRRRYGRASLTPRDLVDTLGYGGFWRFSAQHWRTGVEELRGVLSTRAYLRAARRYVPSIGVADVERAGLGLRAQALAPDGSLVDDFVVDTVGAITVLRNAPSPAATSSLAIAEHVADGVLGSAGRG